MYKPETGFFKTRKLTLYQPFSRLRNGLFFLALAAAASVTAIFSFGVSAESFNTITAPSAVANPAVSCAETTVTAFSEADAWIAPTKSSNTALDPVLNVEANPTAGHSRALIRFALPSSIPPGCVVASARLRMYNVDGTDGAKLEIARLASAWSENSVLWGNQPAADGPVAGAWSTDGYVRWNVTAHVQTMYDSGTNHGFVIRDANEGAVEGGNRHNFNSKEKIENAPQLVIRFGEPSAGDPPAPAPPVPTIVSCGQVLIQSTLVLNDLFHCPGDGLVIGAPRIIVDLNGRTIDGTGLGSGIHNDGYATVTVRNGTLQEFDYGVRLLPESSSNLIDSIRLRFNQVMAIEIFDATDAIIRDNIFDQNARGMEMVNGAGILLRDSNSNTFENNSITGGGDLGIVLKRSNGNALLGNTVSSNSDLGIGLESSVGNTLIGNTVSGNADGAIELRLGSHDNLIAGNLVSQSGDSGILVSESDRCQVIANTAHGMSDIGVWLDAANDSVVRGNDVRFNSDGLKVKGSRNVIEANNASNTTGDGIEVEPDSFENQFILNIASSNSKTGIYIEGGADTGLGNLFDRNTASGNLTSGIVALGGVHTIRANITNNNAGWGIKVLDNIDGGLNVATGNGEFAQCSGVLCRAEWIAPETAISNGPSANTASTSGSFTFSSNEAGTFECSLDTGDFAACTSPKQYTGLPTGPRLFRVRAVDAAGNVDATPAPYNWTIQFSACTSTTITVTASADAWVEENSPINNKGADSVLKVRSKVSAANARALVRFNLPSKPGGCIIESATLRIFSNSARTGRTLQALRLASTWAENGVIWNNQPATAGPAATTASGTGYRQWNVLSQVGSMYDNAAAHGFLIRDATENQDAEQSFNSRQNGSNRPQLVIRFGPG